MASELTQESVLQAVRDFWKAFSGNSFQALADLYSPDANVFGVEGARAELARLALTRRQREYFDRHAKLLARPGAIDVRVLGDSNAIATYSFEFSASNVGSVSGKSLDRAIRHGRATQIFQKGENGELLIVHEHLSSADIKKE
ncbi:MAG TPA: DUF4440 domain-containing protein [Terriglobales bacterium]|nr:DUF4440 domain-containing protein [Terriglobales bacterium]